MNSLFARNPSAECHNRAEYEADFDSGALLRLPSHSIRQPGATIVPPFSCISALISVIFPGTGHARESPTTLRIEATKASDAYESSEARVSSSVLALKQGMPEK